MNLKVCPSTLREGYETFSPTALKLLFDGKRVSHVLPFDAPESESVKEQFRKNQEHISISGAQIKLSLILDKSELRLTREGEHGQYILKPIPDSTTLRKVKMMPANEHLTMQIASQIFGIETAANSLVFFQNGSPAYLTRRFNVMSDGSRRGMDDFATLAGKTKETGGEEFKFDASVEDLFGYLRKVGGAYGIESIKLFRLTLFNYLFANGDAHLKNFSLLETEQSDYVLSPAYDLMNTRLHLDDTALALKKGLFADGYKRDDYNEIHGFIRSDFEMLGKRVGISEKLVQSEIELMLSKVTEVKELAKRSLLDDSTLTSYLNLYDDRRNGLSKNP